MKNACRPELAKKRPSERRRSLCRNRSASAQALATVAVERVHPGVMVQLSPRARTALLTALFVLRHSNLDRERDVSEGTIIMLLVENGLLEWADRLTARLTLLGHAVVESAAATHH